MKQVVQVPGVLPYEPFGFTNCVRFKDVLYLSGISAIDPLGKIVGTDIETQTEETYRTIQKVLRAAAPPLRPRVRPPAGRRGLMFEFLAGASFIVDLPTNGQGYVAVRKKILTRPTYTSATIGVSALMMPGLLLEVQCTAATP